MEIKRVPISKVEVWEKNPRNIKNKDFERLKRQIQELGVYKPLICVQENGKYVTLGGNMRLRALQALDLKEVDISIVEASDEATKIKYALSDNDRAGEYDEQALAELAYPHLEEINLEDYKIDVGEPISLESIIEDYAPNVDGEDEIPEIDDSPAVTKMGDLFTLGRHRLLCGDATKEEDVKRLMNGKKTDMVFTDPPYRLQTEGFGPEEKYKYGGKSSQETPEYSEWLPNVEKVASNNFNIMIWEFWRNIPKLWAEMSKYWKIQNLCIWHAINRYRPWAGKYFFNKYDIFLYGTKGKHVFNNDYMRRGHDVNDIIDHPVSSIHESGQNQVFGAKPVKLLTPYLIVLTNKGSIVLDLFLGSGSILIACEKLNRICMGIEIEPKYCDVIITRNSNFTGISEEKIRATRENPDG